MLSKLAIVFFLPAFVLGQYYPPAPGPASPTGGSSSTASASASAPATVPSAPTTNAPGTIAVDVGPNGKFVFSPANITAPVGTLVTFFFPANVPHSVTQSSFAAPCTYLAANTSASTPAGFDSGLVTASTYTINVTDTQPIWFHCKQVSHCGLGMVGSINAPATGNTFSVFQATAMSVGSSAPSDTNPGVVGGVHGVASSLPSSDTGGSANPAPSSPASGSIKVMAGAGAAALSAMVGGFMLL